MLVIPIPLITALALLVVALRAPARGPVFVALLLACAAQAMLMVLVRHYAVPGISRLLPVSASLIAPLAWAGFIAGTQRPLARADLMHLAGPGFVLFCVLFAPATLDAVLTALFLGYGGLMLWRLRANEALPLAPLSAGARAVWIWRAFAGALIGAGLTDVVIAALYASGRADWIGAVISLYSAAMLAAIGGLALLPDAATPPEPAPGTARDEAPAPPPPPDHDPDADRALIARLDALLDEARLYRDPDLTLARLARRMGVPVKALSGAVNRATGDNISRHINGFRIRHACAALAGGASVTQAMLTAGFNTKSNFNREFRRVTGQSPSEWRV